MNEIEMTEIEKLEERINKLEILMDMMILDYKKQRDFNEIIETLIKNMAEVLNQ